MFDQDPPDSDEDLAALLCGNARGTPAPGTTTTWDFVWRWPEEYRADHVWPVVSQLLVDDDVDVRSHALEFTSGWHEGTALALPRLVELAKQHPEKFVQVDETGTSLRSQLASALANVAPWSNGSRYAPVIWEIAADEPMESGPAIFLAVSSPERMIEHLQRWRERANRAAPAAAGAIAQFHRDELISFLGVTRAFSDATRREILEAVEGSIARDDTKAGLMTKSLGLPAPTRAAPKTDEVRAALGL